jgi:hypothetical protein
MQDKADKLPPAQKVEHLQRRLRKARDELKKRIRAQEATEEQINQLQARRREEIDAVEDQREVAEALRVALERAELDIPPKAAPLQVGRQVRPGDPGDQLKEVSFDQLLAEVQERMTKAAGGAVPDIISRRTEMCVDQLQSAHQECEDGRKAAEAQAARDYRIAMQLHKELYLQSGDTREREGPLDRGGDERMNRAAAATAVDEGDGE